MAEKKKIILGISCGDINGIGLETLLKSFSNNNFFDFCIPVLYAPQSAINYYKKLYSLDGLNYYVINNPKQASLKQMNVIKYFDQSIEMNLGESDKVAAKIAIQSLDLVMQDVKNNLVNVLLTLPVNKQSISVVKKDFVGHTEYLSEKFGNTESLMLLCSNNLRIATATNHVPISGVSKLITKSLLEQKIKILIKTLKIDFLISNPKIAVLSLNPHGGDNGLIGKEDCEIIRPTIDFFFNKGDLIYGPYSADGFFGSGNYKNFDAVLGMYHDQSLIPFKTISFGDGVNYTAGLPIIRVSPAHGVGYDIAGKGVANTSSLSSAIFLSLQLYSNRKLYYEAIRKRETI